MYDWWSKYYLSGKKMKEKVQKGYEEAHMDKLVVYDEELESSFTDGYAQHK